MLFIKHLNTEVDVDDEVMFYVGIISRYLKRGKITGFRNSDNVQFVEIEGDNGYPYHYVSPEDIVMLINQNEDDSSYDEDIHYSNNCLTSPVYDDDCDDCDCNDGYCFNTSYENTDSYSNSDDNYSSNDDNYSSSYSSDSSSDWSSGSDW